MQQKVLRIGHRGAKGYLAENTIASIQKALTFNVDGVEIDVHRCKSGELVVFHDYTLDRLTNGSGEISKHTLQELKILKVANEYTIPTLIEVLDCINKQCFLNIELKGKNTAKETASIIKNYVNTRDWEYNNFIVSSFQHRELEAVFNINKNILLAVLTKANLEEAVAFGNTINAIAIHANYALLSENNVKKTKALGYKINTWTVNDFKTIARMKQYKVDGIISDFPDRV